MRQLSRPRRQFAAKPDGPVPAMPGPIWDVPLYGPDRQRGRRDRPSRPATASTTTFTLSRVLGSFPRAGRLGDERCRKSPSAASRRLRLVAHRRRTALVFATPPAADAARSAQAFAYAFECRFDDDDLDFEQFMSNLWKADSAQIPLGAHVMKATTAAVTNFINAARAAPDAPIAFAECFTFTRRRDVTYTWTNVDLSGSPTTAYRSSPTGRLCKASNIKQLGRPRGRQATDHDRGAGRPTSSTARRSCIALRDGAFDGAASSAIASSCAALGERRSAA